MHSTLDSDSKATIIAILASSGLALLIILPIILYDLLTSVLGV